MYERIYGNGSRNILILHGWLHSSSIYEELAERLAPHCRVHLPDLPGFGNSRDIPVTMSGGSMIKGLVDAVDEYLEGCTYDLIVAHSLGGMIVLRLLARHGELPAPRLLLLNPSYLGPRSPVVRILSRPLWLARLLLHAQATLPLWLAQPFIRLFSLLTVNSRANIDKHIVDDARRANPEIAARLIHEMCIDRWRIAKPVCALKTVIAVSEKDRVISPAAMQTLQSDLGCEAVSVKGIGHTTVVEDMEFVYTRILAMLD